ncbi:hypothetical protein [Dichotomicrobium thermohalophilum]|uniref:hypothetical protein n=1 Tax=Dichotomicrobium thermohalophilum TaxID=933063 RepID=UPI000E5B2CA6|nr:hypothetical protein [Dichotomicrobium thermohalophilum]
MAVIAVVQPDPAKASHNLPDLVIRSVELKASGTCNAFQPIVTGTLVIKNISDVRAPLVVDAPLFEAFGRR